MVKDLVCDSNQLDALHLLHHGNHILAHLTGANQTNAIRAPFFSTRIVFERVSFSYPR